MWTRPARPGPVKRRQARHKQEVVGAKGKLAVAPRRPCGLGTPTTKNYAYFAVDDVEPASFPCSAATSQHSPGPDGARSQAGTLIGVGPQLCGLPRILLPRTPVRTAPSAPVCDPFLSAASCAALGVH